MTNISSYEPSSSSGYEATVSGARNKSAISPVNFPVGQRDVIRVVLLLTAVALSCLLIYKSADNPSQVVLPQWKTNGYNSTKIDNSTVDQRKPASELERVLMNAAMDDKTVIITAINQAWAAPNSTFDVFRESFMAGEGTQRLLKHVVALCLDRNAYDGCLLLHPHCYLINATDSDEISGPNRFMTPGYLKLIWKRMDFLRDVLALGYSFVFTDADIVWLRDPFSRFFPDADFQITCDDYNGKPSDKNNHVNSGFTYVKSSDKTAKFYEFWCNSSRRFPRKHDQDVFNIIKHDPYVAELGIKMRFFDTVYFGGFCQPSRDINVVNTMHANCCIGLDNKVKYLNVVLDDWRRYLSENKTAAVTKWNIPPKCGYK